MVFYYKQGEVPKKRHTVFMKDNLLLREEVFGLNGFSGRYSLLYHLNPPTRIAKVGEWRNNVIEEWKDSGYRHHKFSTGKLRKSNDVFLDRIPLIFNEDVVISYAKMDEGKVNYSIGMLTSMRFITFKRAKLSLGAFSEV